MRQTRLGQTDLKISAIAFGTWAFGGDWGVADVQDSKDVIHRAIELGINFFDTAQAYGFGASERLKEVARARGVSLSQLAIGWTLAHPAVDVAIVGARRPAQLDGTTPAADIELTAADLQKIDAILADAVPLWGPHPEGM